MSRLKKFIVYAPGYSENNGGAIVLHKLCHLLNQEGYEAYLYPSFKIWIMHREFWVKPLLSILWGLVREKYLRRYRTIPNFKTPVFKGGTSKISDDMVVVYAEGVTGNPLNARNVVRWFLHQPGYHNGIVGFGTGELYFDFLAFSHNFELPFSKLSKQRVFLTHFPLEKYNLVGALPEDQRKGTAFCLRKGIDKPQIHHPSDAILIDGLSHDEISKLFKRIKTFISYDPKTAYSVFAALCGADSVVIPDEGVPFEEWAPDERDVFGVAYGFDRLQWSRETRGKILEMIKYNEENHSKTIHSFVDEVNLYFNGKKVHPQSSFNRINAKNKFKTFLV